VLFDEIEKAHPEVFNVFLQVFDEGRLTDGQGRTVNFTNTVIIMTSNIGSDLIKAAGGVDTQRVREAVLRALDQHFRPEFLNRLDEIIIFHSLDRTHIERIVQIQLQRLQKLLARRQITLQLTPAAQAFLAERGYDPVFGARPLKRAIQRYLQDPLAMALLEGNVQENATVVADVASDGERLIFHTAPVTAR
jgi:ATP-dependent Clp protease ATP-binding subunit ClpB